MNEFLIAYDGSKEADYIVGVFNRSRQFKLIVLGNTDYVYGYKDGKFYLRAKTAADMLPGVLTNTRQALAAFTGLDLDFGTAK